MRNAIERRIDRLAEQWAAFAADPSLRLMRWRAGADDRRMIQHFLDLEAETVGTAPDVFVRLSPAFREPARYARELIAAFLAEYEAARDDLETDGISADWQPPEAVPDEPEAASLLRIAGSFHAHHAERMQCLVLVLVPEAVSDDRAFATWLADLLRAGVPPTLRLLALDQAEAPWLDDLDRLAPGQAVTIDPALDMPGALDELARSEGPAGPAKSFRTHLVGLANAAGAGNLVAAEHAARRALDLARQEGWADQAVVAHMALAAAYLGAGRASDAAGCYRQASVAVEAVARTGHPAAAKLRVTAVMGEGAALVAGSRMAEAAGTYERAAPLAEAAGDPVMLLEAWRMAAWSHEQTGADREAWRCGQLALEAGNRLPVEQRSRSTLPWVGQILLRLLERNYGRDDGYRDVVRSRLDRIAGAGWQKALEREGAAP